jgi:transposase
MSKQEKSTILLLENMQKALDKSNKIIEEQAIQIKFLKEQNELQAQRIDYLVRQQFLSKSEKLPDGQLSLFADLENIEIKDEKEEEIEVKYVRKKGGKKRPPEHLPRVRVEHDISEEDKICPCGCKKKVIKEIITEQYDVIPATFQVIQNVRFVYACSNKCGVGPKTTPLAPQMLPKCQVTPSFLATIATQKFEDHLPLYRQVKIYNSRFEMDFTTATFSSWMIKGYELVLIYMINLLNEILLQSDYIQADETTLQVLNEPLSDKELKTVKKSAIVYKGKDKIPIRKPTSNSYIWVRGTTQNNKIVLMDYSATRSMTNANKIFEGFEKGYLQTDGYAGYNDTANKPDVEQLGCWAHIRRKFADTIKNKNVDKKSKTLASNMILKIRKLYIIEKDIKDLTPDEKQKIREEKSQLIIDDIRKYIDEYFDTAISLDGYIKKAFVYINNQFPKLIVYLKDGRLNIDNNIAENHVRPIAVGRKNWLFANSTRGAKSLCGWYSIIETAKMNDLDPYKYLTYILTQIPIYRFENKPLDNLLPWNVNLD